MKGSLIVGDRLYASIQYVRLLAELELYGLFRKNGRLKIKRLKPISKMQGSRSLLEEVLVQVGCGVGQPKVILRLIRFRSNGKSLDLLTTVLDPKKLSAKDAVALYGLRWSIGVPSQGHDSLTGESPVEGKDQPLVARMAWQWAT